MLEFIYIYFGDALDLTIYYYYELQAGLDDSSLKNRQKIVQKIDYLILLKQLEMHCNNNQHMHLLNCAARSSNKP